MMILQNLKRIINLMTRRHPTITMRRNGAPAVRRCPRPGTCSSVPPLEGGVKKCKPSA